MRTQEFSRDELRTGNRRLIQLAKELRTLQANIDAGSQRFLFDLGVWGRTHSTGAFCGTVCCAAGYGTMMPELNKEGFRGTSQNNHRPSYQDPKSDRNYSGFEACSLFFKLDYRQTRRLFSQVQYWKENDYSFEPEPKHVADRIERLVARRRAKDRATRKG